MIKLSDVVKTFCLRLYILLIVFMLLFGINVLAENKNKLQANPSNYVSVGELSVSPHGVNSSNGLSNYMNNIKYRVTNGRFTDYIYSDIITELEEPTGLFADYSELDMRILKTISSDSLKRNISVSCIEDTTIFSVSYKNQSAKVAQGVTNMVLEKMYSILASGDTEDILGGRPINDSNSLSYSITKKATLPSAPTSDINIESSKSSILKLAIFSVLIYIVIVVIYDFVIGYITNKQKVTTLVKADIISEINIPYQKDVKKIDVEVQTAVEEK